jgi:hypothetical protein
MGDKSGAIVADRLKRAVTSKCLRGRFTSDHAAEPPAAARQLLVSAMKGDASQRQSPGAHGL